MGGADEGQQRRRTRVRLTGLPGLSLELITAKVGRMIALSLLIVFCVTMTAVVAILSTSRNTTADRSGPRYE